VVFEVSAAIDEMLALAALPAWRERTALMRAEFEARTGGAPEPGFFEARSAAFWDDALTRGAFGRVLGEGADLREATRNIIEPLARAHRGIFRVEPYESGMFLLVDEWRGAEFAVHPSTSGLRDALACAASLVDGRVAGLRGGRVELLPGAVFHAADALGPMRALLPEARARGLATHDLCDALLRMDHALHSLSRVKAAFAYRKEALPPKKI
jgi:hypothetical protein